MRAPDSLINAGPLVIGECREHGGAATALAFLVEVCEALDHSRAATLWLATERERRQWQLVGGAGDGHDFWHEAALARRVAECVGHAEPVALALATPGWLDAATTNNHAQEAPGRVPTLSAHVVARGFELRTLAAQAGLRFDGQRTEWLSWSPDDADPRAQWLQTLLLGGDLLGLQRGSA